tara:strand:+ start:582 stop:2426 length:1845 start_codon:yes stop_codon:yes gene_type:complete
MKLWHAGITLILCLSIKIWDPFLVEVSRLNFFDYLQRSHEQIKSDQIVLVDIDEKSIQKYGQWPWPREDLAEALSGIPQGNLLGLTLILSEKDRFNTDDILSQTLLQYPSILSTAPTNQIQTERELHVGTATLGRIPAQEYTLDYPGILLPIKELSNASMGYGSISSAPDVDGVTRRLPVVVSANKKIYPSFALEVVRVAVGDISYQLKTDETGILWARVPKFNPVYTTFDGTVYNTYWNSFERISLGEIQAETISPGSIMIVGPTFEGTNIISTSVGGMYPHDVQANLIKTIIDGTTIKRPPEYIVYELLGMLLIGLLILGLLKVAPIFISGASFLVLTSGTIIFAINTFNTKYLLVDPVIPVLTFLLVFAHGAFAQFYTQFKLRQQIQKQFGTYLSPDMVKMLQKDPSLLKLGGERKEMSFLFMDIVGFTPISEYYKNNDDPEGLVELVNEFLDAMTKIILANGGTIDKYMGDCIMAFWNAPLPCENHAEMAVKSAIEIEAKTNELKDVYKARGLPDINVGTGVNTGDCIVGNMGSETRFDYSVIGDAVNLAARLEAKAARHELIDYKTVISSMTADQLSDSYQLKEIGDITVKGKTDVIKIFYPGFKITVD